MNNSEEYSKSSIAFNTAIELWKLASEQIYSRFAAMLTANSIILAIIGLVVSDNINVPSWFVWVLLSAGIVLCLVWIYFMVHGVRVENHYRKKAESLEKKVMPKRSIVLISVTNPNYTGFLSAVTIVVYVFIAVYLAVMILYTIFMGTNTGS